MNILAALGFSVATAGSLLFVGASRFESNPPQGTAERQMVGKVDELWINSLGRIQFRLKITDSQGNSQGKLNKEQQSKDEMLWFKSPADKDINTLFENTTLSLIRHALENKLELTVQAKMSSTEDGSVPAKAIDIMRIGIRFGT